MKSGKCPHGYADPAKCPKCKAAAKGKGDADCYGPLGKNLGMKAKGDASDGDWIKDAIKKPGALRATLKVPAGKEIPAKALQKAQTSKDPTTRKRADLAAVLKKLNKK